MPLVGTVIANRRFGRGPGKAIAFSRSGHVVASIVLPPVIAALIVSLGWISTYRIVFTLPEALREVYTGFGLDLPAANGDDTFRLPVPATYVLGADGTVAWRFVDADYTKRAEPDDVLAAVAAL